LENGLELAFVLSLAVAGNRRKRDWFGQNNLCVGLCSLPISLLLPCLLLLVLFKYWPSVWSHEAPPSQPAKPRNFSTYSYGPICVTQTA